MHHTRVRAVVEADEGLNSTRMSERSGAEEKISRTDFYARRLRLLFRFVSRVCARHAY